MLLGTTALELSGLTGTPDPTPAQPRTKVEAPKTEKHGTLRIMVGVRPFNCRETRPIFENNRSAALSGSIVSDGEPSTWLRIGPRPRAWP